MKFISRCIDSIERRPFIFWSLFLFFLIFSCFEQFLYSVYKTLLSDKVESLFSFILNIGERSASDLGSAAEGLVSSGTAVSAGEVIVGSIIGILILFALSAVISAYFSGYYHILNLSLQANKEKAEGDFKRGVIKHYFKLVFYMFIHLCIIVATIIAGIFAMFPAILSFNMVYKGGNNGLLLTSIFLFIISVLVVAFCVSLVFMYTFYMYPALISFKKGARYMANKVVNTKFWYILPRLMGMVLLFAGWQWYLVHVGYGLSSFQGALAVFVLNGMVKTYLTFSLLFFVFFTFRQIKNAINVGEAEHDEENGKISSNTGPKTSGTKQAAPSRMDTARIPGTAELKRRTGKSMAQRNPAGRTIANSRPQSQMRSSANSVRTYRK